MITLNRENIIEGLIELRKEEEDETKSIIENIKIIITKNGISDVEKLKLINNEMGKRLII
ncbi:MAG: hypothetical protein ACRDA3_12755 [Peptostreptococcaceae bacterium]